MATKKVHWTRVAIIALRMLEVRATQGLLPPYISNMVSGVGVGLDFTMEVDSAVEALRSSEASLTQRHQFAVQLSLAHLYYVLGCGQSMAEVADLVKIYEATDISVQIVLDVLLKNTSTRGYCPEWSQSIVQATRTYGPTTLALYDAKVADVYRTQIAREARGT